MLNQDEFITRLHKVLEYYNLSAANFADEIKVQRSSISHLLSGRNKPSLEFVLKMVSTYKELSLDWLLYGKGMFPKSEKTPPFIEKKLLDKEQQSLFGSENQHKEIEKQELKDVIAINGEKKITTPSDIERIVIFYKDGCFKEYLNP